MFFDQTIKEGARSAARAQAMYCGQGVSLVHRLSIAPRAVGRIVCASALLFLASSRIYAATDAPALAQRAAEFLKQELRHLEAQREREQQTVYQQHELNRIIEIDERQKREDQRWREDMQRGGMPPATPYRRR